MADTMEHIIPLAHEDDNAMPVHKPYLGQTGVMIRFMCDVF